MTVREYYQKNFKKLTPEAQFHFAISLKNWFDTTDYNDFIKDNEPSHDLTELFNDNSHTDIDNYELCKPFLEKKYKGLLGIERALLRVNCLLSEYKIDLRRDLLKLIRKDELFTLADNLLVDDSATTVLSTHAINTICIIDILFPDFEILQFLDKRLGNLSLMTFNCKFRQHLPTFIPVIVNHIHHYIDNIEISVFDGSCGSIINLPRKIELFLLS